MFDWDDANIAHIARHDVEPHETEEAYGSNPVSLSITPRKKAKNDIAR